MAMGAPVRQHPARERKHGPRQAPRFVAARRARLHTQHLHAGRQEQQRKQRAVGNPQSGDHPELAHRGDRRGGQAAEPGGRGDGGQHHRHPDRAEAGDRRGEAVVPARLRRTGANAVAAADGRQQVGGEDVHAVGAAEGHHERRRGDAHDGEIEAQRTHRAHRPHGGDGDHEHRQDHRGQRAKAHIVGCHDHRHRHDQQQRQVAGQVLAGRGVDGRHAGQRNLDPGIAQRLHGLADGGQQRAVVGAQRYVEQNAQGGAVVGKPPARAPAGRPRGAA